MIGFAYFSRAECLGEVQDLFEVFRPDVSMSRSSQTAPSSALIDALPKPCQSPDLRRKYMEMLQMTSERSERSKPSPIWTFQTFEPSQGDIQGYSGWIIGVFLVFLPLGRGATPTPCSTQRPHSLEGKRLRTPTGCLHWFTDAWCIGTCWMPEDLSSAWYRQNPVLFSLRS